MAKVKSPDGPNYENVIEDVVAKLSEWRDSDETPDAFARRLVGLLRMEKTKWERQK